MTNQEQPATQSGGRPTDEEDARADIYEARAARFASALDRYRDTIEARVRAESATALQEARAMKDRMFDAYTSAIARAEAAESEVAALREQVAAQDRELAALSSDKQTLMTAVTHWREQVEGLRAALTEGANHIASLVLHQSDENGRMTLYRADLNALEMRGYSLRAAATRPVPREWEAGDCLECTEPRNKHSLSQDFDFGRDGHIYHPFAPAAPGDGALPPDRACVCGCLGAQHGTRWIEGTFHGTACDLHGGHKFTPAPPDDTKADRAGSPQGGH